VNLEEIYERYADVCFSVALHVLRSPDDAEDCVQDVFARVWQRSDAYRPERGSLRGFLIACVRNDALGRRRAEARHRAIEEREAQLQPSVEFEIADHVEAARVRQGLQRLPPDQRRVLELAYFGGLTHREIAAKLDEPLGTVKSRLALALRRLSRALGVPQGAAP
jgi:RNA polymerase sigma-70 factor (ECF subfamily)